MVAVGTVVEAGVSMAEGFLAMLGSLRRVDSRMRVVRQAGSRVRVVMVGIELLMALGVERMRRGMGCGDGHLVVGLEYRMGGRGFIIAGVIGGAGMDMGMA
jgi:hypothetical protein